MTYGFSMPFPVVALGAVEGMTYGILAVGLVLVYRSNRIINFAHGEIGVLGAAVMGLVVSRWHVPYWAALPLALGIGALVGGASEVIIVRRLRNAPVLMSVVATLGLSQFLHVAALVVNGQVQAGRLFPQPPFVPTFNIGALLVTQSYSAMLFVTPVIVAALFVFLRRSRTGLAIRASAANRDLARLSSVSADSMSTAAWAIAGAISAYTAVLILPTSQVSGGQLLGPSLLFRALTAAVIARMASLPIALVAGVGVGIVEQVLLWNRPNGGVVDAFLFVIILIALLVQRRHSGRDDEQGSWALVQPWPPLPAHLRDVRAVRLLGWYAATAVAVTAVLALALTTNATAFVLSVVVAFAIVGLSIGVVSGLSGELSLGQFALAGVGAVASYVVFSHSGNILFSFAAAGLASAAVSLVIALPALRIRGLMLAVATLGFGLASQTWLFQQSWMLGSGVHPGSPRIGGLVLDDGRKYYAFSLVVLAVAFWLARNLWRGGLGRRLRAVRDNEAAARAFTIPAVRVKLLGFVVGGFLAGLGGAAFGHSFFQLAPANFVVGASIDVVAIAVLGGVGVLVGPLLGALYIVGLPRFLPLDNAEVAATSLGWLVLVLYFPGGIVQALRPGRDALVGWLARRTDAAPTVADAREEIIDFTRAVPTATTRAPSLPGSALLEVRGVAKQFGGVRALAGVDLDVRAGETLGLIGPNGAGKTTLFEIISGFTRPDAGSVTFAGTDVTRRSPEARGRLGLIRSFQDASLFPTMTVREVVMLAQERTSPTRTAPSLLGARREDRRKAAVAGDLVGLMGLEGFADKQVRELSTGTRRIAELACMVALEPTLLLLDEPSSGIAQREVEALGQVLRRLKAHLGLTLVVIEHDMPLIMGLSDRMVAMEAGAVLAVGDPDTVRSDARVVESYLGGELGVIERSGAAPARRHPRDRPLRAR